MDSGTTDQFKSMMLREIRAVLRESLTHTVEKRGNIKMCVHCNEPDPDADEACPARLGGFGGAPWAPVEYDPDGDPVLPTDLREALLVEAVVPIPDGPVPESFGSAVAGLTAAGGLIELDDGRVAYVGHVNGSPVVAITGGDPKFPSSFKVVGREALPMPVRIAVGQAAAKAARAQHGDDVWSQRFARPARKPTKDVRRRELLAKLEGALGKVRSVAEAMERAKVRGAPLLMASLVELTAAIDEARREIESLSASAATADVPPVSTV